jgi:hypothetical protein
MLETLGLTRTCARSDTKRASLGFAKRLRFSPKNGRISNPPFCWRHAFRACPDEFNHGEEINVTTATCPSEATLRWIGIEAIGDGTYVALDAHVEHCLDCQKILEAATNAVPQPAQHAAAWNPLPTLARTVGYFHTRGVVHLELKPSN